MSIRGYGSQMNNPKTFSNSSKMNVLSFSRRQLILILIILVCIFGTIILPRVISVLVNMLALAFFAISGSRAYFNGDRKMVSSVIALPLFLSAFQNVWLGIASARLDEMSLQVLLSSNFLLELFLMVIYILKKGSIPRQDNYCVFITLIFTLQGILLYIMYPTGISAFISSFRNIISCIIIYWVAAIYSQRVDLRTLDRGLIIIAWCVVIFGLFEFLVGTSVWKSLDIERLWNLKSIGTNLWGIPKNWYSSERIGGQQIRRMVSTFADPVNLGTYLFSAFMYAWYKKKKLLRIALLVCCVLTISKGALLGFLIFIVIYTWYKDKSKILPIGAVAAAIAIGMYFISFSRNSSTGSVFAHINGFLSSFGLLASHPFGYGIGRIGVLSSLLSTNFIETGVTETGIGMIMAQLGIIGIAGYIGYFVMLVKAPNNWAPKYINERIIYYSLIFSYITNAMFNEVALSPNSCLLCFLLLGVFNSILSNNR